MLILYTDFGYKGPYVGQMKGVIQQVAPGVPVLDLMHDAPAWDPKASAYLLPALLAPFPPASVFLVVVDPGVGSDREAVAVQADGRWLVGPHNGVFEVIARRAVTVHWWRITWRPDRLSASFHGRDLFAPVAARLARGDGAGGFAEPMPAPAVSGWPEDLAQVVYLDGFGNAMTGFRARGLSSTATVSVGSHVLRRARTFSEVPGGEAFWYANAHGLVEIAVNQGSAEASLGLRPGDAVTIQHA